MAYTVKQARRLRDLTLDEISAMLGVSRYIYMNYEKCPESIPIGIAKKFCEIVNIPIDQIFFINDFTESEGEA